MRILFIDIDTLRPDHMGCYGYSRNTTPNMDQVCREGIRFDQYYCSDAPCLPSRASLVSGMADRLPTGFHRHCGRQLLPQHLPQGGDAHRLGEHLPRAALLLVV